MMNTGIWRLLQTQQETRHHIHITNIGQVTSITDSAGNVTRYEYDSNGNQTAIIDSTGAKTQYQYDSRGNLIQLITSNSQLTTFLMTSSIT